MAEVIFPGNLTWAQVDPAMHSFSDSDAAEAYQIALAEIPATNLSLKIEEEKLRAHTDAITQKFVDRFGAWASGWRWALGEGDLGGGPVSAWCCIPHSWTTQLETARRIEAALKEWRAWIEKLSQRFISLKAKDGESVAAAFTRATAILVSDVVEQTNASDAWYYHCEQILSWYLEAEGVAEDEARKLVEQAIGGKFESWVSPEDELVDSIAEAVATSAADAKRK